MANTKLTALSLVVLSLLLINTTVFAFTLSEDEKGNFLAWDLADMPINYWVSVDNAEGTEKIRAIVRAFESWEIVSSSLVSFRYAGLTKSTAVAYDGINLVTWVKEGWQYDPKTIAYTTLWVTNTGQILDADIELNDEFFDWSTETNDQQMDIQNVLTHEVGHFIGIGHSIETTDSSMFPIISFGEFSKRVVKPDDLGAASFLYPLSESELGVYEVPASDLFDDFSFAKKLATNYEDLGGEGKLLRVAGIRLAKNGDSGLAAILAESDSKALYIYPRPGPLGENLILRAKDAWQIPSGVIKDFTTIDIDGDANDEIAVLKMDEAANHALYIYDAPDDGSFEEKDSRMWVARDLWRIPGESDNLTVFGLDLDGDGMREIATLSYSAEGIYIIKAYTPPNRLDTTYTDAMDLNEGITIPFTTEGIIIDIDSIDVDGDGGDEAVALIKDGYTYSVQVLRLSLPAFPEEVQELKPLLSMSLILNQEEYPFGITVLHGTESEKPVILLLIGR